MTTSSGAPRGAMLAVAAGVPVVLAIAAEGAWISVVAGVVQEYALREPVVALVPMVGLVLVGVVAAAILGPRLGRRWPLVALGLVVLATIGGVLASEAARAGLRSGSLASIGSALAANPGGLFAGLAVLRGFGHARRPMHEESLGLLFGGGLVAIVVATMAGSLVTEPWRAGFVADTLVAGLVFAVTAVLALALTRQAAMGGHAGVDWPRNPAWVALLVILVGLIALVAVPAAAMAPVALELALGLLVAPLIFVGLIAGWTPTGVRILAVVAVLVALIMATAPQGSTPGQTGAGQLGGVAVSDPLTPADEGAILLIGILVALAVLTGVLVLIRLWMRRRGAVGGDYDETRTIDRGGRLPRRPRPHLPSLRLPLPPGDAVAAYRALVRDLAGHPVARRVPSETPIEHARRLRHAGHAGLSLALLAADYGLVRYGGRVLTRREDSRGIRRWRFLRRDLASIIVLPEPERDGPEMDPEGELPRVFRSGG